MPIFNLKVRATKLLAQSLDRLVKKNHQRTNELAKETLVYEIIFQKPTNRLFSYLVKGQQSYSSTKGHIVNILFTDKVIRKNGQLLNKNMLCSCTCPAFRYWGSSYNATEGRYKLGKAEDIAPDIRDPKRERKLCKHIVAVTPLIRKAKVKSVAAPLRITWSNSEIINLCKEAYGIQPNSVEVFGELMLNSVKPNKGD